MAPCIRYLSVDAIKSRDHQQLKEERVCVDLGCQRDETIMCGGKGRAGQGGAAERASGQTVEQGCNLSTSDPNGVCPPAGKPQSSSAWGNRRHLSF